MLTRREESLAAQLVILTIARIAGFVISFAVPLVLVRIFDKSEFGLYKQLFLISGSAVPILTLGLHASLYYFVPRDDGDGHRFIIQALGLLSLTGALALAGLTVGANWISGHFGAPQLAHLLPVLGLFVLLSVPGDIVTALPLIDRRPTLAAATMAGSDLVRSGLMIAAAVLFRDVEAVVWAVIAVAALRGVWLLSYIRWRRPRRARSLNRHDTLLQLRYALPFAIAVLFETGLTRFHEYYAASSLRVADFAIYSVGVLQIPLLGLLVDSVLDVVIIRAAEAHKSEDRATLRGLWYTAIERLALLLIPAWLFFEIMAPDVIGLLFGPAYAGAVPVFRVFTCTMLLWLVLDHGILRATGDTPFLVKANAVGLCVGVLVTLLIGKISAPIGAVAGYVGGFMTVRALGAAQVARRLDIPRRALFSWITLFRLFGVAAVSGAVTILLLRPVEGPHVLRLPLGAAIFGITYLTLVHWYGLLPLRELRALLLRFVPAYR